MRFSKSGAQPSGARNRVQAGVPGARGRWVNTAIADAPRAAVPGVCAPAAGGAMGMYNPMARLAALLIVLLTLGACSSQSWSSINPVNWWHQQEGGAIAQQRPPPPGADQPDPNLASVPPKPPDPDRAALQNITDGLIADRTNAQHTAAAAPLVDPSSPNAAPGLFGVGSTPPPGPPSPPGKTAANTPPNQPPMASATLPAANAPPAPAAPPARAPVNAVQSRPA